MWGDVGRRGETWGDVGRCGETGRCIELVLGVRLQRGEVRPDLGLLGVARSELLEVRHAVLAQLVHLADETGGRRSRGGRVVAVAWRLRGGRAADSHHGDEALVVVGQLRRSALRRIELGA